jgi:hypothetical protein
VGPAGVTNRRNLRPTVYGGYNCGGVLAAFGRAPARRWRLAPVRPCWPRRSIRRPYHPAPRHAAVGLQPQPRIFTARETTTATVTSAARDCSIMRNLAQAVSGIVSVGLNAVALVNDV